MSSPNTQITTTTDFKADKIVFGKPNLGNIPNTKITFHRIPISYENDDGSRGDMVFLTEQVTSFGVKEETDLGTNEPKGTYNLPIALWNMNGATESERLFTDVMNKAIDTCKEHLNICKGDEDFPYSVNDDIVEDMGIRAIYWGKRDNKKQLENPQGAKPYISPKLIQKYVKDNERRMISQFYNDDGDDLDFKDLIGKRVSVRAAIKLESIFCKKGLFSLQIKLLEAEVTFQDTGTKRLISSKPRKVIKQDISEVSVAAPNKDKSSNSDSDSDSDSSSDSDSEEEKIDVDTDEEEKINVKKPPVKRVIKGKK